MRTTTVLAVGAVLLLNSGGATAGTITYTLEDIGTFGGAEQPNSGQGFTGTGFVGLTESSFVHRFGLEADFSKTALQVALGDLAGKTVTSARLTFDLFDGSAAAQPVTVTSFTADGTLYHFWNAPDTLGTGTYTVQGRASNSLDVTAFVQERNTAGAGWLGLHLAGSTAAQFTSTLDGEFLPDRANARLVVEFSEGAAPVPEPTSLSLLALGAAGMAGYRLRRRPQK